jgi:hypothetical protein
MQDGVDAGRALGAGRLPWEAPVLSVLRFARTAGTESPGSDGPGIASLDITAPVKGFTSDGPISGATNTFRNANHSINN